MALYHYCALQLRATGLPVFADGLVSTPAPLKSQSDYLALKHQIQRSGSGFASDGSLITITNLAKIGD